MKRGTLAKRLGYAILRKARVPFKNQKGDLVHDRSTGHIRTKHASSLDEFQKYYKLTLKSDAPHKKELEGATGSGASSQSESGVATKSDAPDKKGPTSKNTSAGSQWKSFTPFGKPNQTSDS